MPVVGKANERDDVEAAAAKDIRISYSSGEVIDLASSFDRVGDCSADRPLSEDRTR